jgi:molybdopterin/thiamine biosynthesis adenylyltransferase
MFNRQILVFGKAGQKILQKMTVGIIGLGGIGSVIFELLVRLGIWRIIAIDHDIVEESNLNRLAGSTRKDVEERIPKVTMLKRYANQISSHTKITAIQKNIHDEKATNCLKSCDAFFGCTDNQSSRWVLNRFSVQNLIPYFDTATGIQADPNLNIEHAGGQIRIVIPGSGCLNCINGIDIAVAQQEMMPEPDRRIAIQRGYIAGADVHAPAVASLNGVIANLAVTEFLAFFTGFKPLQRYIYYDFLKARVVGLNFNRDPNCYICSPTGSFAIGDVGTVLPAEMLVK